MHRTDDRHRPRSRPAPGAPRQVRIVGGRWKRTLLPVADVEDLRPTPDRVRETLFNWLGQNLDGQRVLDLFAGTGALGFEAASRGAARVVLVEAHPRAWRNLLAIRERLEAEGVEVVKADADRWMAAATAAGAVFDLILLDPPFGDDRLPGLLEPVGRLLAPGGRVYVESPCALPAALAGWHLLRAGRAGLVHYHLLEAAANSGSLPLPDLSPSSSSPNSPPPHPISLPAKDDAR